MKTWSSATTSRTDYQTVDPDPVTVAERIKHVIAVVTKPTRFEDLFENDWTKDSLVTTFLAVLDLTKHQVIALAQSERFGPLIVNAGPTKRGIPKWRISHKLRACSSSLTRDQCADLARITGFMKPAVNELLTRLQEKYQADPQTGVTLLNSGEVFRLATKADWRRL